MHKTPNGSDQGGRVASEWPGWGVDTPKSAVGLLNAKEGQAEMSDESRLSPVERERILKGENMGVGMPETLLLQQFGEHVRAAFDGNVPYHVGSSLTLKSGWRDVDVRLLIPDDEYERMGFGGPEDQQQNKKWCALVLAWSAYGKALTGLPIDFQIQQESYANSKFPNQRSALFLLSTLEKYKSNRPSDSSDHARLSAEPASPEEYPAVPRG